MVTHGRMSAVPACPPQLEGWTALSSFANVTDKSPPLLARGLPAGGLCQRADAGAMSYYVRNDRSAFVDLLLTPQRPSLFQMPLISDDELEAAIALIAARRHPDAAAAEQMAAFEKESMPVVNADNAGEDWVVMDVAVVPSLVALIRFEKQDHGNALFRKASDGDSYYVTADTGSLSRLINTLQEVKRDLTVVGLQGAADSVNAMAVQTAMIMTRLQATQPFWKKPLHELWPLVVVGAVGAVGIGWGFHEGGVLAAKLHQGAARLAEWIRNNRRPPSGGAGGAGLGGDVGATRLRSVSMPSDGGNEFSALDDRADAGERADFQMDPSRSYERLEECRISGAAVASVAMACGIVLLLPEVAPFLAGISPEAASVAAGVGAFATSH